MKGFIGVQQGEKRGSNRLAQSQGCACKRGGAIGRSQRDA